MAVSLKASLTPFDTPVPTQTFDPDVNQGSVDSPEELDRISWLCNPKWCFPIKLIEIVDTSVYTSRTDKEISVNDIFFRFSLLVRNPSDVTSISEIEALNTMNTFEQWNDKVYT